jgi:hypothetical protein
MSTIKHAGANRAERRSAPLHTRKLFGGVMTAEEAHAKHAYHANHRCDGCGGKLDVGHIVLRSFISEDDLAKNDPAGFGVMVVKHPDAVAKMRVQMKGTDGNPVPYIRVKTVYACRACAPSAERAAAHGPSYAIVDIQRGPGPDKIVAAVDGFGGDASAEATAVVERAVSNMHLSGGN